MSRNGGYDRYFEQRLRMRMLGDCRARSSKMLQIGEQSTATRGQLATKVAIAIGRPEEIAGSLERHADPEPTPVVIRCHTTSDLPAAIRTTTWRAQERAASPSSMAKRSSCVTPRRLIRMAIDCGISGCRLTSVSDRRRFRIGGPGFGQPAICSGRPIAHRELRRYCPPLAVDCSPRCNRLDDAAALQRSHPQALIGAIIAAIAAQFPAHRRG